jgi:CTP:molybdopterin cytidylyltransferase MocA
MSSVKNAVIAAAGLGARLGMGMPKCMISVDKLTILERMLNVLARHVETIVVVTGYREELIYEFCQNHYRDVVIVRNPQYATTNTAYSLSLGGQFVTGKTIFLDGDLLLEQETLERFFKLAEHVDLLVGVADARTENPVYANCITHAGSDYLTVESFSRQQKGSYEWANLFVGPNDLMDGATGYVFERLAEKLPVQAALINVEEIDTPQDMARAEVAVRAWGM